MNTDNLTLVIKGNFKTLGDQKILNEVYIALQPCLTALSSQNFVDDKRELTFAGNENILYTHTLKVIENRKIKTITVVLK